MSKGWSNKWILWYLDSTVRAFAHHHNEVARNFGALGRAMLTVEHDRAKEVYGRLQRCLELTSPHGMTDPLNGCLQPADRAFLAAFTQPPSRVSQ
jgi:hypothetical protein